MLHYLILHVPRLVDDHRLPRAAFLAVALLDLAPSRVMTRETLAARLWEGAPAAKANGKAAKPIK